MKETLNFYQAMPRAQSKICLALHKIMMKLDPEFEVRRAWAGIGYKQGKNYSAVIYSEKDHVKMMIMRGIMLDDKKNRLAGKGINTRHLKFYSLKDVDEEYLTDLITQQLSLYASGVSWE